MRKGIGELLLRQNAQKGTLAAAVVADQTDPVLIFHGQRDRPQNVVILIELVNSGT